MPILRWQNSQRIPPRSNLLLYFIFRRGNKVNSQFGGNSGLRRGLIMSRTRLLFAPALCAAIVLSAQAVCCLGGEAEKKIVRELDKPTTLEFIDTPLTDVVDYLKDLHGIEIQLDRRALDEAGIGNDVGVSLFEPVANTLSPLGAGETCKLTLGQNKASNEVLVCLNFRSFTVNSDSEKGRGSL